VTLGGPALHLQVAFSGTPEFPFWVCDWESTQKWSTVFYWVTYSTWPSMDCKSQCHCRQNGIFQELWSREPWL